MNASDWDLTSCRQCGVEMLAAARCACYERVGERRYGLRRICLGCRLGNGATADDCRACRWPLQGLVASQVPTHGLVLPYLLSLNGRDELARYLASYVARHGSLTPLQEAWTSARQSSPESRQRWPDLSTSQSAS